MGKSFSSLLNKQKSQAESPKETSNETPQSAEKETVQETEPASERESSPAKSAAFSLRDTLRKSKQQQSGTASTSSQKSTPFKVAGKSPETKDKSDSETVREVDILEGLSDKDFVLDSPDGTQEVGDLDSLAKYQFNEQPEKADEYTVEDFRQQLNILSESVGQDVIDNFNVCLHRLREHPFLAEHLRPEDIGVAVGALRKSYAMTVQAKKTRQTKKQTRKGKHTDAVADSLSDISLF